MTYREAAAFLHRQGRFGDLGLGRITALLERLAHPEDSYPWAHLAGTNGKGSTARLLAALLAAGDHRVGLYTSPSLERYTERISLSGREISPRRFSTGLSTLVDAARDFPDPPTEFEYLTALAFWEFRRAGVDFAVVETGLGGRYDATNVGSPVMSIITGIGRDHVVQLGGSLAGIAAEKAGILKPEIPLVLGRLPAEARDVVLREAKRLNCPVYEAGRDFHTETENLTAKGSLFFYEGPGLQGEFRLGLVGAHQIQNAGLALAAWSLLRAAGFGGDLGAAASMLASVGHPGRWEDLGGDPQLILDGAHNRQGTEALAATVRELLGGRSLTLVTGLLQEKDPEEVLSPLWPLAERIWVTQPPGDRAMPAAILGRELGKRHPAVVVCRRPGPALAEALAATPPEGVVLVAGSLYLIGKLRGWLRRKGRL